MPQFINSASVRSGSIGDLKEGELFVPVVDGGDHFLVGRQGNETVLICLSENDSFGFSPVADWSRADGIIVSDVVVEPDLESATKPFEAMDKVGTIVFSGDAMALVGSRLHNRRAVALRGTLPDSGNAIGFTSWRIVHGEGANMTILYSRQSGPGAATVDFLR